MDNHDPLHVEPKPIGSLSNDAVGSAVDGTRKKRLVMAVALVGVLLVGLVGTLLVLNRDTQPRDQVASAIEISEVVIYVDITTTGFMPATVKAKEGQQVTLTNTDTRPHRILADQALLPGFDSGEELLKGDSYTFVFDKKGTYKYYDQIDAKTYLGTIIVE